VAYIGDDLNDEAIMRAVGLCACPADAMEGILTIADYICLLPGGHGAFREFAELIIQAKTNDITHPAFINGIPQIAYNGNKPINR
ncbi:MAG TPA: hypothetical protein PK228_15245, partial [Saprospiraceae bacterium]|nr:hypothetical protein [Saprospiraceae bacterium]